MINCGKFEIAGVKYRCKPADLNRILKHPDSSLLLEREPGNPHDPNALRCVHGGEDPHFIGYVPATLAKHFAPLIDAGLVFEAKVIGINTPKMQIHAMLVWVDEEGCPE